MIVYRQLRDIHGSTSFSLRYRAFYLFLPIVTQSQWLQIFHKYSTNSHDIPFDPIRYDFFFTQFDGEEEQIEIGIFQLELIDVQ